MKVSIDTNVILDAVGNREPFAASAQRIVLLTAERKINASLTASTASDIYYLIRKHYKSAEDAVDEMKKLFAIFDIVSVDKNDCMKAFTTGMIDYEDSLLAVCASKSKAAYIITRNTKDFIKSPVPAIEPQDFLDKFFK